MKIFTTIVYFLVLTLTCFVTKGVDSEQQPQFYPNVDMIAENGSDRNTDQPELAELYGYSAEVHTVTTDDGYILTMHRVYKKLLLSPPILLVHGVLDCSTSFINMGKDRALALILAEKGYDVWLPNLRGNRYSRKHQTIDPVDKHDWAFWDFSFHENGIYDLPASIDYVLEETGDERVIYIGHSMGTTVSYVMSSMLPQYQSKIQLIVSLAPIAYLTYIRGATKLVIDKTPEIVAFLNETYNTYEVAPNMEWLKQFGVYCTQKELLLTRATCALSLNSLDGFDPIGLDLSSLETIVAAYPAGASAKTFLHYYQIYETGMFRLYDYGPRDNMDHYGNSYPPLYNLSQIYVPVSLIWSTGDYLSSQQDVARLASELPNVVDYYQVKYSAFNHLDYEWGYRVNRETYSHIFDVLNMFT